MCSWWVTKNYRINSNWRIWVSNFIHVLQVGLLCNSLDGPAAWIDDRSIYRVARWRGFQNVSYCTSNFHRTGLDLFYYRRLPFQSDYDKKGTRGVVMISMMRISDNHAFVGSQIDIRRNTKIVFSLTWSTFCWNLVVK